LKPLSRFLLLFTLIFSFAFLVSAQDGGVSLGDYARQLRAKKQAHAEAKEIEGLKIAEFHASILITDTKDAIAHWVLTPTAQRPTAGRLRELTPGKKFYLPAVVSEYPYLASEKMELTAHMRITAPDGRVVLDSPAVSNAIGPDPRSPSTIVLNPVVDITFDENDPAGTYTVRATITDHVHSTYAKAEEQFQLVQDKK
jgi:hypothetical protein